VFGVVLVLGAGLAAVWIRLGFPIPVCYFRQWTGLPCPTCGATRMARALLDGDIGAALAWNPLLFLVLAGVAVWAVASTTGRALGLPNWQVRLRPREQLILRVAVVATLLSGWLYLILRGV
jgi:hypothetical protein